MAVYAPSDRFGAVAETIATDRDEQIVTDLDAIGDGRVVYVAPPTALSDERLIRLQRRLETRGPDRGGFSVVTGLTPTAAAELYERRYEDRTGHEILLRDTTQDWFSYDDETKVRTGDGVSVEALTEAIDETIESLTLTTHGRPIHLYLADGLVCGVDPAVEAEAFDGRQPYCVTDGAVECPYEGATMTGSDLAVPHVFLNSCSSFNPTNDYPGLPINVQLSVLSSVESLIGSYRVLKSGYDHLAALHYSALRAGRDLVERTWLLNEASSVLGAEQYPFVPIGRPSAGAQTDSVTRKQYDATWTETDEGCRLTLTGCDTHLVDEAIPSSLVGDGRIYVRNLSDAHADAPIYATTVQREGRRRVLVYSWGAITAEELRLECSMKPAGADSLATLRDSLQAVPALRSFGLTDRKVRGQLTDLQNLVSGIGSEIERQRYHTNAYRDCETTLSRGIDKLDRIHERIHEYLDRQEDWTIEPLAGADVLHDEATRAPIDCDWCESPVFQRRVTDPVSETARLLGTCTHCGVVYDVPEDDSVAARPRLDGPLAYTEDRESIDLSLTVTNPRPVPMRAVSAIWCSGGPADDRGSVHLSPAHHSHALAPEETETVSVTLDCGALAPNEYWLNGYLIGNARVYECSRRLIVGDQPGQKRVDRLPEEA